MIRVMNVTDYEAVYSLWCATPGMSLRSFDDSRSGIARFLSRNPDTCFVVEEEGELKGCILTGHDGRRGYIYHLAVKETERGKGLGSVLVECACEALAKEGIHKGGLVVFEDNLPGNAFWTARGWNYRKELKYYSRDFD